MHTSARSLEASRYVRLISTAVTVRNTQSVRVTVVAKRGSRLKEPILAGSRVGPFAIHHWQKAIVTGAVPDGRVLLKLLIPNRVLRSGAYMLRVKAVSASLAIRTIYIPIRSAASPPGARNPSREVGTRHVVRRGPTATAPTARE